MSDSSEPAILAGPSFSGGSAPSAPAGLPFGPPPATLPEAVRVYLLASGLGLVDCYLFETPGPVDATGFPYAVVNAITEDPEWNSSGTDYPADAEYQISVVSLGPSPPGRAIRDAAYRLFTPRRNTDGTAANPVLVFSDGALPPFGSLPGGKREFRQTAKGPNGQPIWIFSFSVCFRVTRSR